ncbi:MAG: aminoacyl-tRNA hydrolase [Proteobacteria bacterium]|nr:aminoacyl-tRNA hydrolase [Pseudomonadota bacterium]
MKNYSLLIAGLGNPGPEYELTRHNFGFLAVDHLIDRSGGPDKCPRIEIRGDCLTWECQPVRKLPKVLLTKPQTYMNLSGVAVGKLANKFELPPDRILVIHDDLDLELGRMKLKIGGGDAGHNGIKSIAEHLGSAAFIRLRLGIGRPEGQGGTRDYVLDGFEPQEAEIVNKVLANAIKGIVMLLRMGLQPTVQHINSFDARPKLEKPDES